MRDGRSGFAPDKEDEPSWAFLALGLLFRTLPASDDCDVIISDEDPSLRCKSL
eukprot:m.78966 g.78966  ORF g.78966 m.78966 type:complete len:53 (+) comp50610_c0_seq2:431-589(+)